MKAQGLLRHKFFSEYQAVIVLKFSTELEASKALPILGDGWSYGKPNTVLTWTGNSEDLQRCKSVLGAFGADVSKIDSVATSIDYGEPFYVDVVE